MIFIHGFHGWRGYRNPCHPWLRFGGGVAVTDFFPVIKSADLLSEAFCRIAVLLSCFATGLPRWRRSRTTRQAGCEGLVMVGAERVSFAGSLAAARRYSEALMQARSEARTANGIKAQYTAETRRAQRF